jgi:hypothetical protein
MRKLTFILIVFSFITFGFASTGVSNENHCANIEVIKITERQTETRENSNLVKDCTVRLDFTLEDGTTIQGELTFVDVSWWDCTKMQLGAWWGRNF